MSQDNVVIVSGVRTPMGGFQGSLAAVSAPELGAISIAEAIRRAGLQPADVQEVIMGNVLPAGLKQGPARQAMRQAGLPDSTGATTINKLCGSGMKAAMFAHDVIKAGTNDIMVAGGMESMSNAPYILQGVRSGYRMGPGQAPQDHMFLDGLEDAETGRLMGAFAQEMADKKGYTREEMDEYAITSLTRAKRAIEEGLLKDEIIPVTVKTRKGEVVVEDDEQPHNANIEKIPSLRPAFANFPWHHDPAALKRWQDGMTGYPIVDAGMRERLRIDVHGGVADLGEPQRRRQNRCPHNGLHSRTSHRPGKDAPRRNVPEGDHLGHFDELGEQRPQGSCHRRTTGSFAVSRPVPAILWRRAVRPAAAPGRDAPAPAGPPACAR